MAAFSASSTFSATAGQHRPSNPVVSELSKSLPHLQLVTPSSAGYSTLRSIYTLTHHAHPIAILQPASVQEVSRIVSVAREHQIPITVRTGGHDVHGRCIAADALLIDMRSLNAITISPDKQTVRLGGGTLARDLIAALSTQGLATAFPSVAGVGQVGWATLGGYGYLSPSRGLGVDQIVGAEVVDYRGQLVDAELRSELLQAIKGAGGNFGIITSLTVKVFPLDGLLAGILVLAPNPSIPEALSSFYAGLSTVGPLPTHLYVQPLIINHPETGRTLGVSFIWSSSDIDQGQAWVAKVSTLGPGVVANTVAPITVSEWTKVVDSFCPYGVHSFTRTVSVWPIDAEVLEVLGQYIDTLPDDPATDVSIHTLAAESSSGTPHPDSCFAPEARKPHLVIEIAAVAAIEKNAQQVEAWATDFSAELRKCKAALRGGYVSLLLSGECILEDTYGKEGWAWLKRMKEKWDPEGTWRYAVPRMGLHREGSV